MAEKFVDIKTQYLQMSTLEARRVRHILIDICQIKERTFLNWLDKPEMIKDIYKPFWRAAFRTSNLTNPRK